MWYHLSFVHQIFHYLLLSNADIRIKPCDCIFSTVYNCKGFLWSWRVWFSLSFVEIWFCDILIELWDWTIQKRNRSLQSLTVEYRKLASSNITDIVEHFFWKSKATRWCEYVIRAGTDIHSARGRLGRGNRVLPPKKIKGGRRTPTCTCTSTNNLIWLSQYEHFEAIHVQKRDKKYRCGGLWLPSNLLCLEEFWSIMFPKPKRMRCPRD